MKEKTESIRLDRFLAEQLNISRTEAAELVKRNKITVNGAVTKSRDTRISPEKDIICSCGREITYRKFIYIMLNKPAGVVCATRDALSDTVLELIPPELRRKGLFPAGRLDKDTEGFVFITDDGALAHKMLSPKNHVEKLYYAELLHEAEESYIPAFERGMTIDGGEVCLPAIIQICENKKNVLITLCEGKYHQVKRMISALGNEVVYLKRICIGGIPLDDALAPGQCREILHKELALLYTK